MDVRRLQPTAHSRVGLLHLGLGPLGLLLQQDLHTRKLGRLVQAVDPDPRLAGRPLRELVPGAADGLRVLGALEEVGDWEPIDCALVTTSSELTRCADTFGALLRKGKAVVSTCEELAWPWLRHAALARELDQLARAHGGRLLGTGVNPGFVMDALPVFASAVARSVRSVRVQRIQDAGMRRIPFQQKVGVGLDRAGFEARVRAGSLRHVGLGESLHFLAHALGFTLERWDETLEPVLASRALPSAAGPIALGGVCGVRQVARGFVRGEPRLVLEFQAAVGQEDPHDRVVIDGEPPLDLVLRGGIHGDIATTAIVLNCVGPLLASAPGLHTMASIPLPACSDAGRTA